MKPKTFMRTIQFLKGSVFPTYFLLIFLNLIYIDNVNAQTFDGGTGSTLGNQTINTDGLNMQSSSGSESSSSSSSNELVNSSAQAISFGLQYGNTQALGLGVAGLLVNGLFNAPPKSPEQIQRERERQAQLRWQEQERLRLIEEARLRKIAEEKRIFDAKKQKGLESMQGLSNQSLDPGLIGAQSKTLEPGLLKSEKTKNGSASIEAKQLYDDGLVLLKKGNYKEAQIKFANAYYKNPELYEKSPQFFNDIGYAALMNGDLKNAEIYFLKAVKNDETNVYAHMNLGSIYEIVGLNEEAKKQFKEALKTDPNNKIAKSSLENLEIQKNNQSDKIANAYEEQKAFQKKDQEKINEIYKQQQINQEKEQERINKIYQQGKTPQENNSNDNVAKVNELKSKEKQLQKEHSELEKELAEIRENIRIGDGDIGALQVKESQLKQALSKTEGDQNLVKNQLGLIQPSTVVQSSNSANNNNGNTAPANAGSTTGAFGSPESKPTKGNLNEESNNWNNNVTARDAFGQAEKLGVKLPPPATQKGKPVKTSTEIKENKLAEIRPEFREILKEENKLKEESAKIIKEGDMLLLEIKEKGAKATVEDWDKLQKKADDLKSVDKKLEVKAKEKEEQLNSYSFEEDEEK